MPLSTYYHHPGHAHPTILRPSRSYYPNTSNLSSSFMDSSGDSSLFTRSSFGTFAPGCSTFAPGCREDYGYQRMNVTISDPLDRARLASAPLFAGETCAGYGIDDIPVKTKRPSRVRRVFRELLAMRSRMSSKEPKVVSPRSTSLSLPRRGEESFAVPRPRIQRRETEGILYTPTRDAYEGYQRHYVDQERAPSKRRSIVAWIEDKRRGASRKRDGRDASRDAYVRTNSADTVLDDRRVWLEEDSRRRRKSSGPKDDDVMMKRSKREKEAIRVRTYETQTPSTVTFVEPAAARRRERPSRRNRERNRDAFVNSHEWTLSRAVSELRLGIVGCAAKTALVHRYLTGHYNPDESPEGGRFKKEVRSSDGIDHLLLIREEGIAEPDAPFTAWADAVLIVYSVTERESFERLPALYQRMIECRAPAEMPIIMVATKDAVSEVSPRVVTEEQGKRMAARLGRCAYYETNAKNGVNVERLFKEAVSKMFSYRRHSLGGGGRVPTPTEKYNTDPRLSSLYASASKPSSSSSAAFPYPSAPTHQRSISAVPGPMEHAFGGSHGSRRSHVYGSSSARAPLPFPTTSGIVASSAYASRASQLEPPRGLSPSASTKSIGSIGNGAYTRSSAALLDHHVLHNGYSATGSGVIGMPGAEASVSTSHLPTPSSTPTTQRKNRRISNIFRPSKDHKEHHGIHSSGGHHQEVGVGRAIPVMQGQLYKRSGGKGLNRGDWKKKFVTLTSDGKLTYHQTLKEYMDNVSGKEVYLGLAAVRIPGRQRTRNSQAASTTSIISESAHETSGEGAALAASGEGTSGGGSDDGGIAPHHTTVGASVPATPQTVATAKKRRGHSKRLIGVGGGGGRKDDEDEECFEIITCDQKRWEFCASSVEEREEWVKAIESQIDAALQNQLSKPRNEARIMGARAEVQAIVDLPGNGRCADCDAPRPEWASLNLGTVICMECSGVHRNLGTHISKVRSLKFDDWPVEHLAVMRALGNAAASRLWESRMEQSDRIRSDASTEVREAFIRSKYASKRWLAPLANDSTPLTQQLVGAVLSGDIHATAGLLIRASPSDVNAPVSLNDRRTVLHLACSSGCVEIVVLLLWNNADLRALDERGRSALVHATNSDAKDCVDVLIAAGLTPDYGWCSGGGGGGNSNEEPQIILGSVSARDFSDSRRATVGPSA